MSQGFSTSEAEYRVVDVLLRLHRDLFEIETILIRNAALQHRLTRISSNGRMGALVAGLLAIVPVLISLADIKWQSAPAVTVYGLAGAVVLLWAYQVHAAGRVEKELASADHASTDDLGDRTDFILEEINAWVMRHRLISAILRELRGADAGHEAADNRRELVQKRERYSEILEQCEQYVGNLLEASGRLVNDGKRSPDHHAAILDWAAAIPRFATGGQDR